MGTIKLTGAALETARKIKDEGEAAVDEYNVLAEQLEAVRAKWNDRHAALTAELRANLRMTSFQHCHLDLTYLDEHGLAFVKTGCDDELGEPAATTLN